jgi:4-diphosphocytidyl-2-C-methyl-D-erythritol kinase
MEMAEPAPAKINLALHVRSRRGDGYHEIETLFAFLRDGDLLSIALADAETFELCGPFGSDLAPTPDNLVLRARNAFAEIFGPVPPLRITLDKRLPIASGIGGGSADAAAMLRLLARLNGVAVDDPRLSACALGLGADVPACLGGISAIGTGIGERLVPLAGLGGVPVLLVNPGVSVSTAAVFRGWDRVDRGPLGQGDALAIARAGRNDLEPAARALAPVIDAVLADLARLPGVTLSRMSGSGATCFALFDRAADCTAAAATIAAAHPDWWQLQSVLV